MKFFRWIETRIVWLYKPARKLLIYLMCSRAKWGVKDSMGTQYTKLEPGLPSALLKTHLGAENCTARMMYCHHSCCGLDNLNTTGILFLKTCHTIALSADSFLKSIARDVPSCTIIFCIFKVFFLKSKEVNLIKKKNLPRPSLLYLLKPSWNLTIYICSWIVPVGFCSVTDVAGISQNWHSS